MFIFGLIIGAIIAIFLYACIIVSKDADEVITSKEDNRNNTFSSEQVACYGAIALYNLKKSGNLEITEPLFYSYILALIDLYSKEEIEEIYNKVRQAD